MGAGGWRKTVKDRNAWKLILKQARVLLGKQSQWKERKTERKRERDLLHPRIQNKNSQRQ
jgi:hypothetical protein